MTASTRLEIVDELPMAFGDVGVVGAWTAREGVGLRHLVAMDQPTALTRRFPLASQTDARVDSRLAASHLDIVLA